MVRELTTNDRIVLICAHVEFSSYRHYTIVVVYTMITVLIYIFYYYLFFNHNVKYCCRKLTVASNFQVANYIISVTTLIS